MVRLLTCFCILYRFATAFSSVIDENGSYQGDPGISGAQLTALSEEFQELTMKNKDLTDELEAVRDECDHHIKLLRTDIDAREARELDLNEQNATLAREHEAKEKEVKTLRHRAKALDESLEEATTHKLNAEQVSN